MSVLARRLLSWSLLSVVRYAVTPASPLNSGHPQRILVIRLGAIGDALRVLPAVRRLRIERPEAIIGLAVSARGGKIATGSWSPPPPPPPSSRSRRR